MESLTVSFDHGVSLLYSFGVRSPNWFGQPIIEPYSKDNTNIANIISDVFTSNCNKCKILKYNPKSCKIGQDLAKNDFYFFISPEETVPLSDINLPWASQTIAFSKQKNSSILLGWESGVEKFKFRKNISDENKWTNNADHSGRVETRHNCDCTGGFKKVIQSLKTHVIYCVPYTYIINLDTCLLNCYNLYLIK